VLRLLFFWVVNILLAIEIMVEKTAETQRALRKEIKRNK